MYACFSTSLEVTKGELIEKETTRQTIVNLLIVARF